MVSRVTLGWVGSQFLLEGPLPTGSRSKAQSFPRGSAHSPRHLEPPAVKPALMSPTAALPGMLLLRPCVHILPRLFLFLALAQAVTCLPHHWHTAQFDWGTGHPPPPTHTPLGSNFEKVPQWLGRMKNKSLKRKALEWKAGGCSVPRIQTQS